MGFVDSVKGFAGKFGESVERGAKTVSNNSKKFAEKNKVKRDIAKIESEINGDYIELGKALYDKVCNDETGEYAAMITDIKEKNSKLEELRAVLLSLEDKAYCTSCGAQISKEQLFCDKCGAKVAVPEPEAAEVVEAEVVEQGGEAEFSSADADAE